MTAFTTKKIIKAQNFGDQLKEARQEKYVSLEKAAKDLNIAYKYLEAMENNQISALPGRAYLKSFLREYCRYLNLDFGNLWEAAKKLSLADSQGFDAIDKKYFSAWPRKIKKVVIGLMVVAVIFFLIYKINEIFQPPALVIFEPKEGLITSERQLKVTGQSQKEAEIVINNKLIFVDNKGKFETLVDLQNGLNLIKISAKKRYSREQALEIRVLFTEENNGVNK